MRKMVSHRLARRIFSLIAIGSLLTFWIMLSRTDLVIEQALVDQAKLQARVFLEGVRSDITQLDDPSDPVQLQQAVKRAIERDSDALSFGILHIYAFDRNGTILAHSTPGEYRPKTIEAHYQQLFDYGTPYLGESIEYVEDPLTSEQLPKVDIIVPVRVDGESRIALEVEIDLADTIGTIRELASRYNSEIFTIVIASAALILLFIWWVVHRWMLSPIESMALTTQHIAKGQFAARVAVERRDELGSLAESINEMADSIVELFNEQESAHIEMLQSLAKALEAKDAYTAGHSERVAHYSVMLGRRLGLPPRQLQLLEQGALLHDLGKIGITDTILNKPGQLNDEEYEEIKRHPVVTADIMRPLSRFKEFVEIAAWHHERWDGTGYPDGLKGTAIPLLARIVSIADSWDAMTGDRAYRKGVPTESALALLEREKESGQWDPQLVNEFIAMVHDKRIDDELYRLESLKLVPQAG